MAPILPIETIAAATDQWIQDVVRQHLKEDVHFVEIKRKQKDSRDGFLSETLFLDVIMTGRESLALVIKLAPVDKGMKDFVIDGKLAETEAAYYKAMSTPNFSDKLKTLGVIPPLPSVLYCEFKNRVFTLVMKNLAAGDIKLSSPLPGESADLELTKLAIESLAVMHAIGYAYVDQYGITELGVLGKKNVAYELKMTSLFETGLDLALAETQISDSPILESLRKLKATKEYSLFFDDTETEMQSTLCHGDYWITQIMYNKQMKKLSIIDWQFAQLGNPAYDIVSFLANSSDIPVYRNHLEEVIQSYTSKLNEYLQKMNCTVKFTSDQVLRSVDKAWPRGYLMMFTGLDVMMEPKYITVEKLDDMLKHAFSKSILK